MTAHEAEHAAAGVISDDGCYDLATLAEQVGVSERTVRRWMEDPVNPLPSHHVRGSFKDRGRVLIFGSEFKAWVRSFPAAQSKRAAPARAAVEEADPDVTAWVKRLSKP